MQLKFTLKKYLLMITITVIGLLYGAVMAAQVSDKPPEEVAKIAEPSKLAPKIHGGLHLLIDVDTSAMIKAQQENDIRNMEMTLKEENIDYVSIRQHDNHEIQINFRNQKSLNNAYKYLYRNNPDYKFQVIDKDGKYQLKAILNNAKLTELQDYAVNQTITIIGTRIYNLGVSDPIISRQGVNQISIDLPGVQDTVRIKDLLSKRATLRFQLVDTENDLASALAGSVPVDAKIYYEGNGQPVLLKNQVILRGDSIISAIASLSEDGRFQVTLTLESSAAVRFHKATYENIGKPLAVIYVETVMDQQIVDGKPVTKWLDKETVISIATIQTALGDYFRITGLSSARFAEDLALLIRSGALAAPIKIVEERFYKLPKEVP